jgi:aspartyl protease family protein
MKSNNVVSRFSLVSSGGCCVFKRIPASLRMLQVLFFSASCMSGITYAANSVGSPAGSGEAQPEAAMAEEADKIVLHVGRGGHFRGVMTINNVSMPYLIDTGASITSIPMKQALAANLPLGKQIENHTANGKAFGLLTSIKSLKLNTVEFQNIKAGVLQNLDEVLLGMNALKYFKIVQAGDTLTLTLNKNSVNKAEADKDLLILSGQPPAGQAGPPPSSANSVSRPIKSSVVCDDKNHCITRFDNE